MKDQLGKNNTICATYQACLVFPPEPRLESSSELEALTQLFVIGVMFPFDTPKSFRVVSNFGTQCGMWTPSGKVTLEFKADGTWICKDTELSGNWKLTSQHLLDFEKHGLRTLYKPLLGTESFVQIEGDDDRLEIFIPETDHQSVSFRLYRGPIEENQKYPPIFLWKCNDKCVCIQFGTITGHGNIKRMIPSRQDSIFIVRNKLHICTHLNQSPA